MIPRDLILLRIPCMIMQSMSKRSLSRSSQQPRRQGKNYRLWAIPGDLVYRKDILAKQYTMKWHPGLNVGIDGERSIYALCDGVMFITEDKFDPDWSHPLVDSVYMKDDVKQAPLYKRYIHVLPEKTAPEFKLIDAV